MQIRYFTHVYFQRNSEVLTIPQMVKFLNLDQYYHKTLTVSSVAHVPSFLRIL